MEVATDTGIYAVIKRDGTMEAFERDKVSPISTSEPEMHMLIVVDQRKTFEEREIYATRILNLAVSKMKTPVETRDIEDIVAETANELDYVDIVYGGVAASVALASVYKETEDSFSSAMKRFSNLWNDNFDQVVKLNQKELDEMIDPARDIFITYTALRTILRTYAVREGSTLCERPQYVFLRTAVQIHGSDLVSVKACYDDLSLFRASHGSPALFNSGFKKPQLSSCFLLPAEDNPDDIMESLAQVSRICRSGGGIGLGFQSLPAKGSIVNGVERSGIEPILKLFDAGVDVIDQSVKKRPSAMCIYVEPWHADVFSILRQKKIRGAAEDGARKLFYALWVPDLFMERVEEDGEWTLFCPTDVPTLPHLFDQEFEESYISAESAGLGRRKIRARALWQAIIECQIESGGPSILFKDSINRKSNESHLGTITQGNLCTEIVQYADGDETAVCTLGSIILPSFVNSNKTFDFKTMEETVRRLVLSLNRVISVSWYPTSSAKASAKGHRAIGIGVQGLADAFALMNVAFDSAEAAKLNIEIAETIQYAAYDASSDLIKEFGIYSSFEDSPLSNGWLQSDRWNSPVFSGRYDWHSLREKLKKGAANSLSASNPSPGTVHHACPGSSQSFSAYWSNGFSDWVSGRKTFATKSLLMEVRSIVSSIVHREVSNDDAYFSQGSIQKIEAIPAEIKTVFKTVWDIDQDVLVQMAAARGPFIDQSQSLSLYFDKPVVSEVSKRVFLGWKMGLKTGLYYLRTKPAAIPLPVTLPVEYWGGYTGTGARADPICVSCSG
ncbi:hypothetical protein NMY22_g1345 [Coprinellus aureogranulatus]|nr:hypothetical protein NMY22_g1345 [Coprinellus aureogranulatus]